MSKLRAKGLLQEKRLTISEEILFAISAWRCQAEYNMKNGGYETELIRCDESHECISSTLVRERLDGNECISDLVPPSVEEYIRSIDNR